MRAKRMDRQQFTVVAAAWFSGLVVVATVAASSTCYSSLASPLPPQCKQLSRVCLDHSVYVLYGTKHNPQHREFQGLPDLHLKNITLDMYGVDDSWDGGLQHPGPVLRSATAREETRELAQPQFSRCTLPLVVYAHHLHNYGDFFLNTVAPLYIMQLNRTFDRRLTLVVDTFGMRLQPFHRFLLSPLSVYRVATLSHLSSRLPQARPEGYTAEAQHVRCFKHLLVCAMRGSGSAAAAALAAASPIHHPLWSTAQAVFNYYKRRLPAIDPGFADKSKLKVLIAAQQRGDKMRAMVNQEQVWSWCSKFKPPVGVYGWNGTACLLHEFGKNLLSDLVYVSQADVLLALHSDVLYWAFFMRLHGNVVEVRPRGFAGPQANQGMKEVSAADGDSIQWWGIDIVNPAHSAPGPLEAQQRGNRQHWARERHVFMRLMACQYIFERIALSRGSPDAYSEFRQRSQHHITDRLEPAWEDGVYDTHTAAAPDGSSTAQAAQQPGAAAAAAAGAQVPADAAPVTRDVHVQDTQATAAAMTTAAAAADGHQAARGAARLLQQWLPDM